jgi:protein-arginine kinase
MNIGTALQVNIRVKLSNLDKLDQMIDLSQRLDIHLQNTNEKNIFNLSNRIRLGRSEFHTIRSIWDGIRQIIEQDIQG